MEWAHGVGSGSDLPIPASTAILGATAALTISFAVLVLAWSKPRYQDDASAPAAQRHRDRPAPAVLARLVDSRAFAVALRVVGLAVLAFAVVCVVAGEDDTSTNPVFGLVYVVLWVGLVPASLLLGPAVRAVSPARTLRDLLVRLLPAERRDGVVRLPDAVGYWPAAVGLVAFTWLELVSPNGTVLATVATWFVGYFVVMVGGGLLFGERWFERADPFEVYSTLVAHLSPWSRDGTGRLVVVSPLRHLPRVVVRPGLVAVVGVLLGSTAFDSFRDSATWVRFRQDHPDSITLWETLLLVAACALVTAVFAAATAAPTPARGVARRDVPGLLAHSVVPIVVGYMTAHYLTLFVETGQLTLIQASDPLGTGANLFGTADRNVDIWLSTHPTLLASIKVLAIVLGHLVGVVAAHDRALRLLPKGRHDTGQLPLLLVMVAFTFGGLYLIFGL
ncbi:hypothetical protein GCM10023340_43700 [Nocardioides marinquilinus]|uniref:Fenitrothion hydrolase n=1 Tax=Nocardioides marinquilinus TaxID=1210400 RepID=A0ABP9Q7I5_9ACTN